ncbi:MAG: DUF4147 domain-containing protein [Anaerolineales bacterium]|nr:DUF4147 domain-containing protein [Anaerolineales bacterium]
MAPYFADYPEHVLKLYQAALAAADPATAVSAQLQITGSDLLIGGQQHYDLRQGNIFLVAVGKAAVPMAQAASQALGATPHTGIVISKTLPARLTLPEVITVYTGNHPVPGPDSLAATTAVHDLLQTTAAQDLVLCLISGGASALLSQPLVSLADWQALNRALLVSGCPIAEFNTVRRQLDAVKGGGLADWAAPARCISLILSDVVGNALPFIGSGPTVPGSDTPADALAVLDRYDMAKKLANLLFRRLQIALAQRPSHRTTDPPPHFIIGDVQQAAQAALLRAAQSGFTTQLLTARLEGEAREVGRVAAAIAKDTPPDHCLVLGGETTVTLSGDGLGGRNLETALAAAISLAGEPRVVVASLATDGEDGPTDAAGAMVTGETAVLAQQANLLPRAFLNNNDSYHFFQTLDQQTTGSPPCLLRSGPTGTNVNDLVFILRYRE